jgi:hypothetical protein
MKRRQTTERAAGRQVAVSGRLKLHVSADDLDDPKAAV